MSLRPVALILSQTAVRWSGRDVGVELIRVVLHVGLRRGEAEAVDRRIGIADGAQRIFELALAAVIERLADAKDRSPIAGWLFAQLVDGEAKTIQDGCSTIAWLQVCHHSGDVVQVGSELCFDVWLTVESDDGHTV